MANIWLAQVDLENATSTQSVLAAFDDNNIGSPQANAVQAVISRAEQETLSWLDELGPPPFSATKLAQLGSDAFLKFAALEYAITYMYERRPEYFKSSSDDIALRLKRCEERMTRIKDARQRPPTVPIQPANVGGVSVDGAARIYIDNPDGTKNSGDY